jgi:hypothetical protein
MRYAHDLQSRDWNCNKHELLEGLSIAAGLTTNVRSGLSERPDAVLHRASPPSRHRHATSMTAGR